MPARVLDVLLGIYLFVCAACLVWPGFAWFAAREEPFVLGLPFAFAWSVGWVIATFLALCAYHVARSRVGGSRA
ncbi:MAG: DUF3311 domain-containing protein [Planctomycetota bacterium]